MNIYNLLKINRLIKSSRIKLLGILFLHHLKKRYLGVFLDPILACNLRCQMCYFSDEQKRKALTGKLSQHEINAIAKKFFPYALKLQIGCGAEPTLYHNITDIIILAKQYGVPYISMTTNANLLKKEDLRKYIKAGLNEITISLHGVKQKTYETLMENASYQKFIEVLSFVRELKTEFKNFKLRINYTINEDNCLELQNFFNVFGNYSIDILQLRPIQKIGESKYDNFSWQVLIDNYDTTVNKLKQESKQRNITVISPNKEDLTKQTNNQSIVFDYTYIYISAKEIFANDFSIDSDTYHGYQKKHNFYSRILKRIFSKNLNSTLKTKLNYEIK
ncbi:MAG: radical SAM protein [Bacteroidales bacterium]